MNGAEPGAWKAHWKKAQEHGVKASIVIGTDLETSQKAVGLAVTEPAFRAAIGVHPMHVETVSGMSVVKELETLLSSKKNKIVAIGEVGLDYFRLEENQTDIKKQQRELFITQIELAKKYNLPIILHVRDKEVPEKETPGNAYWDVLTTMNKYHKGQTPLVLHCVSGPQDYVKQMLELGAYIGVAANVTYNSADAIRALVKLAPSDKILLETDAPFLPPQEFRGKICEPWMITKTAEFLEESIRISNKQILTNTNKLFPSLPA